MVERMSREDGRNSLFFGLGTIGRDMFYAFEANALIYYLSNILNLPLQTFVAVSFVFTVLRIFDAFNDPFVGLIIDNGRWKHGKFKPPILLGGIIGAISYLVLFSDFGIRDLRFVIIFALAYLIWDIFYGLNDIAYWSMLPALSINQKAREKTGAFARICANIGLFVIMVAWQPVTTAWGGDSKAWFGVAMVVTVLMLLFLLFPLLGVKERTYAAQAEEKTTLKGLWITLSRNDQLMWTTLSMSLFTVGYVSSTSIAIYYMQYVYGDAGTYPLLALVVGLAQIVALIIFPFISAKLPRRKFYTLATVIVLLGYVVFFFAERALTLIIIAALALFIGQAFIQLLMLMFLADTVEYGQWKLGKRSESITFSVQPLINKIGGAIATGMVSLSLLLSGIKRSTEAAEAIGYEGKLIIKLFMIVIPLIFIVSGYVIYLRKYKLDEARYAKIVAELEAKGELRVER